MGEELQRQIQSMLSVRSRLRRPPNAVRDNGINLRRHKDAPAPAKIALPIPPVPKLPEIRNPNPDVNWWAGRITPAMILHRVAEFYYGKNAEREIPALSGGRRTHRYVRPRQIFIYLCFKLIPGVTCGLVNRVIRKDHTTILYARKAILQRLVIGDDKLSADIAAIERLVRGDQTDATVPAQYESDLAAGENMGRKAGRTPEQILQNVAPVSPCGVVAAAPQSTGQAYSGPVQCELDLSSSQPAALRCG